MHSMEKRCLGYFLHIDADTLNENQQLIHSDKGTEFELPILHGLWKDLVILVSMRGYFQLLHLA